MKTIMMSLASVLVVAGVSFACGGDENCKDCKDGAKQEAKQDDCGGCEGEAKKAKQDECGGCEGEAKEQQADSGCGSEEGCGGCMEMASNPVFDQMKTLVGEWTGKMGEQTLNLSYHLTANGTALVETLLPGTPKEMVTVYHLDGTELVMTHYCASGSQPMMKMVKVKDGAFVFEHVGGTNCDPAKGFMGGLTLTVEEGKLKYDWVVLKDGKPAQHIEFELTRARETK